MAPDRSREPSTLGAANYIHSLELAPRERESFLDEGRWLVLVFAVWSVADRATVDAAARVARYFAGAIELGVRPFDDPAEARTWAPEAADSGSPIWLILQDGVVVGRRVGAFPEDDVKRWVSLTLALQRP